VRSNDTAATEATAPVSLCHFSAACPLPTGLHTIRAPVLLPRASAPASYVISASLHHPSHSLAPAALTIAARVHETLRVRGCAPCGTVLAYTRNGTPSACASAARRRSHVTRSSSQFFPTAMTKAPETGASGALPPPPSRDKTLTRWWQLQWLVDVGTAVRLLSLPSSLKCNPCHMYQCVELVQRYIPPRLASSSPAAAQTAPRYYQEMYPVDYAAQMCERHPSNM
jgi:hypothetical protein